MVTTTKVKPKPVKNRSQNSPKETFRNRCNWPFDIEEASKRDTGPYTVQNAITLLEEEPLELYNGWLVWKEMTDPIERRIAGTIQVILDLTARTYHFGQAYPDQLECMMTMANGKEGMLKPDVCVVSNQRFESQVLPIALESEHLVMKGSPELVIELRSPSNRRIKERLKRQNYFQNGTLVVWDVAPEKRKIWVYEVENPQKATEYGEDDTITCERLFPGWKRLVADFFSKDLTAEQMVGETAKEWRAESREEGRAEGRAEGMLEALRMMLLNQAHHRFESEKLPNNLEARLAHYKVEQLTDLVSSIATSPTLEEWLANFPD
jgi:Uma2 family endonuclease